MEIVMSKRFTRESNTLISSANALAHNLRVVAKHVGDARSDELVQEADNLSEMAAFLKLVAATPYADVNPHIAEVLRGEIQRARQALHADGIKELLQRFGEIPF
jgi:hypothetical protein